MHSFFSNRNIRLYCEDVFTALQNIPAESIDLIFADPPYNLSNGGFSCHAGKRVSVNKGKWDKSQGIEKDYQFHFDWIEACKRILKPTGSLCFRHLPFNLCLRFFLTKTRLAYFK